MVYGILLESIIQTFVLERYDKVVFEQIEEYVQHSLTNLNLFELYDDHLMVGIAEALSDIVQEGGPDLYMQYFGECFVKFFTNYGYDKILRVAGRHFRDFLHSIDQLHDSTRFSFPKMQSPLFHVAEEDDAGAILHYKSKRRGFQRYIVGQLKECAWKFFKQEILIRVKDDISTNEYTHIVFRLDFNNTMARAKYTRFMQGLQMPDISSDTFFKVFPFSILIDPQMRIRHMGSSLVHVFPRDTVLIGRSLEELFRLIRPDIPFQWTNLLSYGRHIVFVIESRIPLRQNILMPSRNIGATTNAHIRLKGQMKLVSTWDMIVFLCHPILSTTDDMVSTGLYLHDLNFYDGSSEILITGMQHARTLQLAIDKQHAWITKLQNSKLELQEWRRKSKRLLYSLMPRHIANMLQDGVLANSICESHKLLTVLFCYSIDFKDIVSKLQPQEIVESINCLVNTFDQCSECFDVFKVEMKADSSYMVVAGIQDRSVNPTRRGSTASQSTTYSISIADELMPEIKNPLGLNQAEIVASLALELVKSAKKVINPVTKESFRVKFGFHSGPAVGGIVGAKNFQYCLFGDTVNTASRVTTTGQPGKVHLSTTSYALLKDSPYFAIEYKGITELKGKGSLDTYWLNSHTPAYVSALEENSMSVGQQELLRHTNQQSGTFMETPRTLTTKRSSISNTINKRQSLMNGNCPFGNQIIQIDSSLNHKD